MAVDVTTVGSPGWYMQQMWRQLLVEQRRYNRLEAYRRGRPEIVIGSKRLASAFYRFQNMSRSNFADLIISAMTNRMAVRSIRTSASNDDAGDQVATRIWVANGMPVLQTDLFRMMATFGVAYAAAAGPVEPGGEPVITIEDPRQMTTIQDPLRPWVTVAAFKIFHDPVAGFDYAVLWLRPQSPGGPGLKFVARRARKARPPQGRDDAPTAGGAPNLPGGAGAFTASAFDFVPFGTAGPDGAVVWDDVQPDGFPPVDGDLADYDGITSESYTVPMPVVRIGNRDGRGEFEDHTDLLDRIAHTTLQQMVIVTLQAFKQRALKLSAEAGDDGGLPDEDENGNEIDYNEVFEADPGALWKLPVGAEIWESGQVDMQGILSASKDYVLTLAATSQTPFPMFSPDSANQSANGASLYREGLTFKVEDRCRIAGAGLAQLLAVAMQIKGGDGASALNAADIIIDWAPADRYSIVEMAQADALSTLPAAQKFARIYGMSPAEVSIAQAQAAQQAFQQAALVPKPPLPPTGLTPLPPLPVGVGSGS